MAAAPATAKEPETIEAPPVKVAAFGETGVAVPLVEELGTGRAADADGT